MRKRLLWPLLIVSCLVLQCYSLLRAVNLSFVIDESLSYTIVAEDSGLRATPNDHPFNTAAMQLAHRWLGDREWNFRLANVLAHGVYLVAGMLLLRGLGTPAVLLGFGLLNLNPFLFDFFGLARGYGIANAFLLLSLYLLKEAWDHPGSSKGRAFLFFSALVAALAVLGNFAWLNFQLALLAVAVMLIVADYRGLKVWSPRILAFVVAFLIINGTAVLYFAIRLLAMRAEGGLEIGTNLGFIGGTAGSLAQLYFYDANNAAPGRDVLLYGVLAAVTTGGVWLIVRVIRRRRVSFSGVLLVILALACLAPVSEHILFNTMFPVDRLALYYVPLTGAFLAFLADEIASKYLWWGRIASASCVVLAGAMVIHFARTVNLTHTALWWYDASTRDVISEIERRVRAGNVQPPVTVGAFWPYEPTLNFYRGVRKYTWLERVTRDPPEAKPYDFLYCPIGLDLGEARKNYTLVRQYPLTNSELLVGSRIKQ